MFKTLGILLLVAGTYCDDETEKILISFFGPSSEIDDQGSGPAANENRDKNTASAAPSTKIDSSILKSVFGPTYIENHDNTETSSVVPKIGNKAGDIDAVLYQVFGPTATPDKDNPSSTKLHNKTSQEGYFFYTTVKTPQAAELSLKNKDAAEIEDTIETKPSLDASCGRRKLLHTELIVHGQPTQPGEWPWHAAILKFDGLSLKYICGGTLLSKTLVLTAAHCATIGNNAVVPFSLSVVLGKYNLIGGDIAAQERRVIVHPEYDVKTLNNDIALLILNSEVVFDDFVQPACLWHPALPTKEVFGKVAGWGFNHQDRLSLTLQQTTVPIVSELKCLKKDPIFFQKKLNGNKFCGGFANGTSVCNGDSGGGLVIFVPDRPNGSGKVTGAWYVRGIVSLAARRRHDVNICDPHQYSIFTDVDKYRGWVMKNWS